MGQPILIAPSMLSADPDRLFEATQGVEKAGADWIHLDIMDGRFVPNQTIGPEVVAKIRGATRLPFDVHLMIESPEKHLKRFVEAGADRVTVHQEACQDLKAVIDQIKQLGAKAGVALRPQTDAKILDGVLDQIDLVLVMTVNPGLGGQAFMADMLPKIKQIRQNYSGHIQVDGGINHETGKQCLDAGANVLVAGTYVLGAENPAQAIGALRGKNPPPASAPKTSESDYIT